MLAAASEWGRGHPRAMMGCGVGVGIRLTLVGYGKAKNALFRGPLGGAGRGKQSTRAHELYSVKGTWAPRAKLDFKPLLTTYKWTASPMPMEAHLEPLLHVSTASTISAGRHQPFVEDGTTLPSQYQLHTVLVE